MKTGRTVVLSFLQLVSFISVLHFEGTNCDVVQFSPNTAALVDAQSVELNCTIQSDPKLFLMWTAIFSWRSGSSSIRTNENFTLSADNTNLRINSLKKDLAAEYQCIDTGIDSDLDIRGSTKVAAFEALICPDNIIVNNSESELISCDGFYYLYETSFDPSMLPTLVMDNLKNNYLVAAKATGPGNFSVSDNITFTPDWSGEEIGCRIIYERSPPSYHDNCSFIVHVNHFVTEVSVQGFESSESSPRPVFVDDLINCTANGYPEPTISWLSNEDEVISADYSLLITSGMVSYPNTVIYKCVASNSLFGEAANASLLVYLTVYASRDEIQSAGVAVWVIVLAVVLPILIIAAVVIVVLLCCKRKRTKRSKPKTAATSSAIYAPAPTYDNGATSIPPRPTSYQQPPPQRTTYSVNMMPNPQAGPMQSAGRDSSGHGDLGVSVVNPSQRTNGSLNSSTASSQVVPTPRSTVQRPGYPYNGSRDGINQVASPPPPHVVNTNQNAGNRATVYPPQPAVRQPSITSGSSTESRSTAVRPPVGPPSRPNIDLASLHGSEV